MDTETGYYYLQTRYYDPDIRRFISSDSYDLIPTLAQSGDLNMYAYCGNNPVMYTDPTGYMPEWLRDFLDIGLYIVSAAAAVAIGVTVSIVANPGVGIMAGIATFGALNNLTNTIYYNYISDGESSLTPSSYQDGYINRWDRLDYVKKQTGQNSYNTTAWMYFSEYNMHMYAWYISGWAYEKDNPFSIIAKGARSADINVGAWDSRWYINIGIIFFGLLGL